MNKDRRARIARLVANLQAALDSIDAEGAETIRDEEQEYYENMPESFQNGDKGTAAQDAITNLDTAQEKSDDAVNALTEAIEALGDAQA